MPHQFAMRATHNNAGIAASHFIKTVDDAEIHSYDDALKFLGGRGSRKIGSNVMVIANKPIHRDAWIEFPYAIAIRLYGTDILTYHKPTAKGEFFEADNGGYNTITTATRCQQFGPKGDWFCHGDKKLMANGHQTGLGILLPVRVCV
jgi:hypothetical protein